MLLCQSVFIAALALAVKVASGQSEEKLVRSFAEENRCQPDAIRYDRDTCFWADENGGDGYTQPEAAEACRARGMEMTSIHSEAENEFISGLPTFTGAVWIGLSDEDHNDTYKWSDGTPLDYVNWAAGNPDGGDQNCVVLQISSGLWYDGRCTPAEGVVCRGPPDYEPLD